MLAGPNIIVVRIVIDRYLLGCRLRRRFLLPLLKNGVEVGRREWMAIYCVMLVELAIIYAAMVATADVCVRWSLMSAGRGKLDES
jgi:hypothetical protein